MPYSVDKQPNAKTVKFRMAINSDSMRAGKGRHTANEARVTPQKIGTAERSLLSRIAPFQYSAGFVVSAFLSPSSLLDFGTP